MDTKAHASLSGVIDLLLDAVCVVDEEGRFVFVSAAFERIFGYAPAEIIGTRMIELVAPEDRSRTLQAAGKIMSGHPMLHFENRYVRKDGRIVHIMWTARWSEADRLRIAVARDITERKQAESMQAALYAISEAAHAAEDLLDLFQRIHRIIDGLLPARNFAVALDEAGTGRLDFPYHVDERDCASERMKSAAAVLFAEVLRSGKPLLLTPDTLPAFPQPVQEAAGGDALCWLVVPLNSQRGAMGALFLKSDVREACYTEKDKDLLQFVSDQVGTAINRKQLHARLQYSAQYDELTGLPNRRLLFDRLEIALARARRSSEPMSVLYLDLDKFKQVNDSLGHAAGDQLLQQVALRLKACVRDSDTVARMGGDEFVVILENMRLPEHAAAVADKIRHAIGQPVDIGAHRLHILPSIGIALYPDHGDAAQQLLMHADIAMYDAKKGRAAPADIQAGLGSGTSG